MRLVPMYLGPGVRAIGLQYLRNAFSLFQLPRPNWLRNPASSRIPLPSAMVSIRSMSPFTLNIVQRCYQARGSACRG